MTAARELKRGYTLVELIVAVGLFAVVMTLATGAYLVMIGAQRQTQGLATGIDNLSFVFESMTTAMRTGTAYCSNSDCSDNTNSSTFSYRDSQGRYVTYGLVSGAIDTCVSTTAFCAPNVSITAPQVTVTGLTFNPTGTAGYATGDNVQPYVRIVITGTVSVAPGKTRTFAVETSAIMRGADI